MKHPFSHRRGLNFGAFSLITALVLGSGLTAQAQLVADGATRTINNTSVNLGTTNLTVGTNGPNTTLIVTSGGKLTNAMAFIGLNSGSTNNRVTVTGLNSVWNSSGDLSVGENGAFNTLLITNGGRVSDTQGSIGVYSGANSNAVTVSGTNSAWNIGSDLFVGYSGAFNTLLITGGGTVTNLSGHIGEDAGADGNAVTVSGPGSAWKLGDSLYLGAYGSFNTLLITNRGQVNEAQGIIGLYAGASNAVTVIGTNSAWNSGGGLIVGYRGSFNTLLISGGGRVTNDTGFIGFDSDANRNAVTVSGTNTAWNSGANLKVGYGGSFNTLLISGGGRVTNDWGTIGDLSGANGNAVTVSGAGSTWKHSYDLSVGAYGSFNTLLITNGGTVSDSWGFIGTSAGAKSNAVTVSGPTAIWKNSSYLYVGYLGSFSTLLITNGGAVEASSAIVGGFGGASNSVLRFANGVLTVPGGLTVNNNSAVTGSGTISGTLTVSNNGTLSPGDSIGKIILSNSPALQGTVVMEISKSGATLTNDQLQVISSLAYGGALIVTNIGPDTLALGSSFKLFNASGGYSGAFSAITLPPLPAGLGWTNQLLVNGSIAVVANPTTLSIGGLTRSGTNLSFNVTGGASGGTWNQLTTTNVVLPILSWTTNRSGNFDVLGNVTLTNGINSAERQRYYRVKTP